MSQQSRSGIVRDEKLIFEVSKAGRKGYSLPRLDLPPQPLENLLPPAYIRDDIPGFPEVSEVEVVRHFTRLSTWNYGIDTGLYPLGSCTMKYNPKVNEKVSALEEFAISHPYQPEELAQGNIEMIKTLEEFLAEITGMDAVSLQVAAGAHGELAGLMLIRAYHDSRKEKKTRVLIPDSAHGTNPASAFFAGYRVEVVPSNPRGCVDLDHLRQVVDPEVAALMLTNPNTLGLFEEEILQIAELIHDAGGLIYCDGANMNALMGIAKPGDMGIDVLHLNLHKTFSTPHGGGGPGGGAVAVKSILEPFLPVPVIDKGKGGYSFNYNRPQSIGKVRSFYGNFAVMVKALAYILTMGAEGLRRVSEAAVVNANYIRKKLTGIYHLPYDRPSMHEVVFSDKIQAAKGVHTIDIAKRLMDYGFHPPTIYFPLIVHGALMIEPTETESVEELDTFIEAMKSIAREAEENPELVRSAPHRTKISRLDEVTAARKPVLRWQP